ncbi:MAG: bifunctional DNA-formamidopyrimidine glycosylase/DNA-(apurinic or apyrimidinic site) lyase [Spirochaetaceae bacterium]|nr:MAG: bifunctional DNA-formamidopyrimidine glycosylase/DNA-(apurinic or apyrimidinic site) lyase [Spirochaetaceae bacterium]
MPELPEVQTTIDNLIASGIIGEQIVAAEVGWPRTVGGDSTAFAAAIRGRRIAALARRGKYIICALHDGAGAGAGGHGPARLWAICHLRMSGRLHLVGPAEPRGGYERLVLQCASGRELRFVDPRKFGRFLLSTNPALMLDKLGPEPLAQDFTAEVLGAVLGGRRRALKPTLLDQGVIAGLGNIYVDEALFCARLHPLRRADSLTAAEVAVLHNAIQRVLRQGLANLGVSLGNGHSNFRLPNGASGGNQQALRVFRRTGLPCRQCATPIQRIVVAQRSTHFCPRCQPAPEL